MMRTLNELKVSERVMLRQLQSYSHPSERVRLPRIYKALPASNIPQIHRDNNGRVTYAQPLVPLWYNAITSRNAVELKTPKCLSSINIGVTPKKYHSRTLKTAHTNKKFECYANWCHEQGADAMFLSVVSKWVRWMVYYFNLCASLYL